jgi:hypothetical protein
LKAIDDNAKVAEQSAAQHHHSNLWLEVEYPQYAQFRPQGASIDQPAGNQSEPGASRDQGKLQIIAENIGNHSTRRVRPVVGPQQGFAIPATRRIQDPSIRLKIADA